jgi:hypothetical protein
VVHALEGATLDDCRAAGAHGVQRDRRGESP